MNRPTRPVPRLVLLGIGVLVLAGCGNDFGLETAPERPDDEIDVPVLGNPTGPGGPSGPPDGPRSPWDDIQPGNIPDVFLAVAHNEYDCTGGENLDGGVGIWVDCPGTYAVIDLEGQVVAEFEVPRDDAEEWGYVRHLELRPAGPGQFLALVENFSQSGSWEAPDTDGLYVNPTVQVWLADAVTGTMTLVVQVVDTGRTALVQTNGRRVRLDETIGTAMIGLWPDADESKLVMWGGNNSCAGGVAPLRAVEMGSGATLDWVWGRNQLLPEDMRDGCVYQPWNMDGGIDEEGRPSLLLGLSELHLPGGDVAEVPRERLVAWSPEDGPMWDLPIESLPWPPLASYTGWNGGGALYITGSAYEVGQYWHVVSPEGAHEGAVPVDLMDVRPGPLLDPRGPTFLVFGRTNIDGRHSIRLIHRDRQTWAIDALRFGLSPQRRFISDVVLTIPLPE